MKRIITRYYAITFATLMFLLLIQNATFASCLYWTTAGHLGTNGIRTINIDNTGETKLADSLYPFDVAVDMGSQDIFWTDGYGTIGRANLDGSNQQNIISGLDKPWGIAIDSKKKKLYWTDTNLGKIQRANFDGSYVEDVVVGLSKPREIEIDPFENTMYWIENGSGKIKRAGLDGTSVEVLVGGLPSNSYGVSGIGLDLVNGTMYWTEDSSTRKIRRANLDGTDITDVLTGNQPVSVTVDPIGGHLYWTNYTSGEIYQANLDGSDNELLLSAYRPIGIIFVPEPATFALFAIGGLAIRKRK